MVRFCLAKLKRQFMKKLSLKRTFALATSAIALTTAFVGCSDYTGVFTNDQLDNLYNQKAYDEAFEAKFGKIDPNQDWGMNEEIGYIEAFSPLATRAGRVEVNRNEWTKYGSQSHNQGDKATREETFPTYNNAPKETVRVPNYDTDALAHDIQIPGWPHLNGLYYWADGNTLGGAYKGSQIRSQMIPAGDITPYEIQYVSNWFRTHKITNPEDYRLNLHLSDFFIQNVSCDFDQIEYRESNIDEYRDGWEHTGENGRNIQHKEDVATYNLKAVDGSDYATNLSEDISYELDYLGFKDMDGNWTHVNNFNRGNSNFSPEDNNNNPNREIKYIKSAGTEDFHCRPSWCTGDLGDEEAPYTEYINTWVLVRLQWVETVKDANSPYPVGTQIPREGYYLAFDFHGKKQGQGGDQVVKQDGYYSNWIIKITPGHFNPAGKARRVFCEDLGGSLDFDFNDAVFDVAFEKNGNKFQPIISVQAAGGTMPIYVEKNDPRYELHELLDAPSTTPVNVDERNVRLPAIYRGAEIESTQPGKISITVKNTNNNQTYTINGSNADDYSDERNDDLNYTDYNDKTKVAPRAFSTPTSVRWMQEWKGIEGSYPNFIDWVKDKNWLGGPESNSHWYDLAQNKHNLFNYSISVDDRTPISNGESSYDDGLDWTILYPDPNASLTVRAVNADSYMKLNEYTGSDAIVKKLDTMEDDDRVTFVVILSSSNLYVQNGTPLKGVLVPADINSANGNLISNGHEFTPSTVFNNQNYTTFVNAAYVPNVAQNHSITGNAYTLQFSFAKSDIKRKGDAQSGYHDYLILYLKVGDQQVAVGANHGVSIAEWFVHY